jgi:glycosyltransferase involved in cell wall biosynthesis
VVAVAANHDVVVVVPAYNEAGVLADVLNALHEHFSHVVVVDDGSHDGSADVARAAGAIVLRHPLNLGQGAALQTGFDYVVRHTDARYVVTFDSDGQHDPVDAVAMVGAARTSGVHVVLGSRTLGTAQHQPPLRRAVLRLALLFTRATTGLPLSDSHNGLRVLSRQAVAVLRLRQRGMAHASELLMAIAGSGLTWVEHPVNITYTEYSLSKGQSNLNAFNVLYDLTVDRLVRARS